MKIKNNLFLEEDLNHPTDYESVALFNELEYSPLLEKFNECYDLSLEKKELIYNSWKRFSKRTVEDEIFDKLNIEKYLINNSNYNKKETN